jgi:hypothetical protein
MPIPLGILAVAGAGAAAPPAYELISTTLVSSTTSSVSFDVSTLASTYKHLQIRFTGRGTGTGSNRLELRARFNNDSGTSYADHELLGDGTSVSSNGQTSRNYMYVCSIHDSTDANLFATAILDIINFGSTSQNKTLKSFGGHYTSYGSRRVGLWSALWLNSNAITSVLLYDNSSGFVSGSRLSIYGIKG